MIERDQFASSKKPRRKAAVEVVAGKPNKVKPDFAPKKLDMETTKVLQGIKDKINKKSFGRKIRDSEIVAKALSLLSAKHIKELQESTLSEKDRLGMAHEEFQKIHGKLSLDQFIGRLLRGEVPLNSRKSN